MSRFSSLLIAALCAIVAMYAGVQTAHADDKPAEAVNLALNKPATASSAESDEHAAGKANDGDDDSRWCADGDSTPQWWQVDLEKPATIGGISIKWEFDEKSYKYILEGSADNAAWTTLSDQSKTDSTKQVQTITLEKPAEGIRYVRVRIVGLDDGCWASIFEVKVYGKGVAVVEPVNLALNKPATASATESDEHDASKADDGDEDTRWCADGDSTPQWWQVDLQKPATLTGVYIKWEFDEKSYKYIVEGSADNEKWTTLSDQSKTDSTKQVQTITFEKPAENIRYLRIRIVSLDDGCWASIFEVKVFGKQ